MKTRDNAGLTLLELMVSISISAILITITLSAWDYLNRHVSYQESRASLRSETARVADEIALNLRRTPGLLRLDENSVAFLGQSGDDTLEYAFDGESLTRNGAPVHFGVYGGSITSFSLNSAAAGDSEYLTLEAYVASEDRRGYRDTCRFVITVKNAQAGFLR